MAYDCFDCTATAVINWLLLTLKIGELTKSMELLKDVSSSDKTQKLWFDQKLIGCKNFSLIYWYNITVIVDWLWV